MSHTHTSARPPTKPDPRRGATVLAAILTLALATACGETVEPSVTTSVLVTPSSSTLTTEGGTVQLTATARDQNGDEMADATFTWTSEDPAVASVDADGTVTAETNGTTTVSATTDGVAGQASVTVDFPVAKGISVHPGNVTLSELDQTVGLTATVTDQNGAPMTDIVVSWSTPDAGVVSVAQDGTVTAQGNGIATVIATADGVSDEASIVVATSLAYVSHRYSESATGTNPVYVVKVATGEILDSVMVGSIAGEVAILPGGDRAYVPAFPTQPGDAWVIETSTNTVSGTIGVGATPIYSAASPDGRYVYIGNVGSQTVSIIETATGTEVAAVGVNGLPRGLGITPDGSRLYVAIGDDCPGQVDIIDTETRMFAGTVPLDACAGGDVEVSPDGTVAYALAGGTSTISVIDVATNTLTGTITGVNSPRDVAFTADGARAYVTEYHSDGDVVVIDVSTRSVVEEIDLGVSRAPHTLALSPEGAFAYVVSTQTQEVAVLSIRTNTVVRFVRVGQDPFHVDITPF